ncbi:MAG: response regulator, partial [Planctomycetota bacterium]
MVGEVTGESAGTGAAPRPVVLVVDDEETIRASCVQVLERDGFEVIVAAAAARALELMAKRLPDVLLVDLRMPGMSGEEFLTKARETDPQIVAVVITGHATMRLAVDA